MYEIVIFKYAGTVKWKHRTLKYMDAEAEDELSARFRNTSASFDETTNTGAIEPAEARF